MTLRGDMTEDRELIALRRRVLDLEQEVAEWRRTGQPGAAVESRINAQALAARIGPQGRCPLWAARLLLHMLAHPGQVHTFDGLLPHVAVGDMIRGDHTKTVHVAVCLARKMLRPHGLERGLETVRGVGYRMTPACAAAIKALTGEARA